MYQAAGMIARLDRGRGGQEGVHSAHTAGRRQPVHRHAPVRSLACPACGSPGTDDLPPRSSQPATVLVLTAITHPDATGPRHAAAPRRRPPARRGGQAHRRRHPTPGGPRAVGRLRDQPAPVGARIGDGRGGQRDRRDRVPAGGGGGHPRDRLHRPGACDPGLHADRPLRRPRRRRRGSADRRPARTARRGDAPRGRRPGRRLCAAPVRRLRAVTPAA